MSYEINGVADAKALLGTTWICGNVVRIITGVEEVEVCRYDKKTVNADIYWKHPQSDERKYPTPLKKFKAWMDKATQIKDEVE